MRMTNSWKRMHGAAVVVLFVSRIKDFIFPLLLTFFAGGTGTLFGQEWIFPALLLVLFLHSLFSWLFFRFRLEEQELRIKQGIFVKKRRYIQRKKVQSVDISAGIIQRTFGLVKIKIETAGGGMVPEVSIIALSKDDAEEIRESLLYGAAESVSAEETGAIDEDTAVDKIREEVTYQNKIPARYIFYAGITSGKVGLFFSAAAAIFSQFDQFIPESFYESTVGYILDLSLWFLVLFFFLMAIIAWIGSTVVTMLQYGQFEIKLINKEMIIKRGLLEKKQLTLRPERITSVRYTCNPLQQMLGFWRIYIDSAGGGSEKESFSTVLLPLGSKTMAEEIIHHIRPDLHMDQDLARVPKRAARRYIFRASWMGWLLAGAAAIWVPYGSALFVLPLLLTWLGWTQYRAAGLAENHNKLVLQNRLISKQHAVLPKTAIQSYTKQYHYLQKRNQLCSITVDILSSSGGRAFSLRDLDNEKGKDLLQWFSEPAEQKEVPAD